MIERARAEGRGLAHFGTQVFGTEALTLNGHRVPRYRLALPTGLRQKPTSPAYLENFASGTTPDAPEVLTDSGPNRLKEMQHSDLPRQHSVNNLIPAFPEPRCCGLTGHYEGVAFHEKTGTIFT